MPIIAIYFFDVLIEFFKIIKNEFLHFKICLIIDTKLNFCQLKTLLKYAHTPTH
jgi:hypothetical protein